MRKRLALALALLTAVALTVVAPASSADALLLVKFGKAPGCAVDLGHRFADPIKHHNEPEPAGHEHAYFGSPVPLQFGDATTYADMIAMGSNPCATELQDTAGGWVPVLYDANGNPVPMLHASAYYRDGSGRNQGPAIAIPEGAKLVGTQYNWTCGQKSGALSAPIDHIPTCVQTGRPGLTLTLHVTFPSFWDGTPPNTDESTVGDVEDTAHYAYPVAKHAPPGFPIDVAQLRETIEYNVPVGADYSGLYLSSDAEHGVTGGRSAHGDYWQTWQHGGLQARIATCVNGTVEARGCS